MSDKLRVLESLARSTGNSVIQWAADEIARLREERRWSTGNSVIQWAATEIAHLREERQWISVEERLPILNDENRFQVHCLACCDNGNVCEMTYRINTYAEQERHRQPRWTLWGRSAPWKVTHWQPLPPPPGGEVGE